jgi:hypothetical protein
MYNILYYFLNIYNKLTSHSYTVWESIEIFKKVHEKDKKLIFFARSLHNSR